MKLFFNKQKTETEEQFVIRWADALIFNVSTNGEIDTTGFALDYHLSTFGFKEVIKANNNPSNPFRDKVLKSIKQDDAETIHLDKIVHALLKFRTEVETHFLKEEYINPIKSDGKSIISDKGKEMREWGGHEKYKAHKTKERMALISDQNAKIYWWKRDLFKWIGGGIVGYGLKFLIDLIRQQ
ncbi:MAG: hypothetical protein JJE22_18525 [Bacteroidia bacterium]|nr:hypothetical protein [Bacteroidia bacterium]